MFSAQSNHPVSSNLSSSRDRSLSLLGFVWMGLQLCPFLFTGYLTTITPRWGTEMAGSTDFRVILRLTLVAIPFLLTIEFLVQQLLWAGIRNAVSRMDRSRRLLQPILLLLFGTLTFVFHLLLASNWYLFYRTGSFYSWESILLSIHALDFAFLAITFGSLSFLGFALAATALLGFTAWLCYGFWSSSVEVRPLLKRLLTLSLVSAMLTLLPPVLFARGSIPAIKNLAHHLLSPNISLIWLPLVAGLDSEPRISKDELATLRLRPQTSIPPQLSQTSPPQNIVILAVEGLRADVLDDCARPEPDFPTLCKLAREGLTFPLAYSNAAETSESLLTIISGQYPLRSPIRESKPRRNPHSDSLFREAQESGYSTAFFGESWSSISMPELSGNLNLEFDPSVDLGVPVPLLSPLKNTLLPRLGYYSLTKADRAKMEGLLRWQATNRIQGKRSFSLLYFYSTHYPYDQYEEVPQKHSPTFVGEDYTWLHYDSHLKPMMWNRYLNTIAYVDFVLGEVLARLERSGVPYVFIYLSDHGESLMEEGRMFHGMPPGMSLPPEQAEVPLIVKASVPIQVVERDHYPQQDVFDTVLDLLSIESTVSDRRRSFVKRVAAETPAAN